MQSLRLSKFARRRQQTTESIESNIELKFKLEIKMACRDAKAGPYFKWDGDRFKTNSDSIKMQTEMLYGMNIIITPNEGNE